MRVAYCVTCHKNTPVLRELVAELTKTSDVFIHVDKKSEISQFQEYESNDRATLIKKRFNITWGSFSQIESTLALYKSFDVMQYEYISLISGDTLPLRPAAEIQDFFEENHGKQFFFHDTNIVNVERRVKWHHSWYWFNRENSFVIKLLRKLSLIKRKIGLEEENKHFNILPPLYKGSNWTCMTSDCCKYILDYLVANPDYFEAFRHSFCCDEVFFHTIVFNSKYKDSVVRKGLVYADWNTGPQYPRTVDETDFDRILQASREQGFIFGRKISDDLNLEKYREVFRI